MDFGQALLNQFVLRRYSSMGKGPWVPPDGRGISGDIFCLGCLLLYLATGKEPPFRADEPIEDDEDVKRVIEGTISEENPELYRANSGVADLIAHCLRANVRQNSRAKSVEQLQREMNPLFQVPSAPVRHAEVQRSISGLKRCNPMLRGLADDHLRAWLAMVEGFKRGVFDLPGSHEEIVLEMSRFLSFLDKGDQYVTISQPSFWLPQNLGVKGRFLAMNIRAAKSGAEIRRVFL